MDDDETERSVCPEWDPLRRLIEPHFAPEPMARFEPVCDANLRATYPAGGHRSAWVVLDDAG